MRVCNRSKSYHAFVACCAMLVRSGKAKGPGLKQCVCSMSCCQRLMTSWGQRGVHSNLHELGSNTSKNSKGREPLTSLPKPSLRDPQ